MKNDSKRIFLFTPEKPVEPEPENKAEGSEKMLPCLELVCLDFSPCTMGDRRSINSVNRGGESRGIAIEFIGDYLENDDIVIENVVLEQGWGKTGTKRTPIAMEKRIYSDGMCILYWEDEDFIIPERVDPKLPRDTYCRMELERSIGISFVPKGNPRKALDIIAAIIPIENAKREASAVWYAWKNHNSKESYIRRNNTEIMQRIMKIEKSENANTLYPWLLKTMLLDPDDFDL